MKSTASRTQNIEEQRDNPERDDAAVNALQRNDRKSETFHSDAEQHLSLSLSSSFQISFLCLKEVMQKERLKNEDGEENGGIERQ